MRRVIARVVIGIADTVRVVMGWPRGCCRFVPSCSSYAAEVIMRETPLRALGLIARRLLRCGPWCKGGYDPVPQGGGEGKRFYG